MGFAVVRDGKGWHYEIATAMVAWRGMSKRRAEMRKRNFPGVAIAAFLVLGACSGRVGEPSLSSVAVAPPAPGLARVYFYREFEPYESLSRPWIYVDGRRFAVSEPGGVSFRDVLPGSHDITVCSPGLYPDQFKSVDLRPRDTLYVRIESLRSWYRGFNWERDTFVVRLIDQGQASPEIARMRYVRNDGL
jgi:hypothetical protein